MKQIKINMWINVISFLVLIFVIVSSIALLLKGDLRTANVFLGLNRQAWTGIHSISGIFLIILILVHLILHKSWIKQLPKIIKN